MSSAPGRDERDSLLRLLASRDLAWLVRIVRARLTKGIPLTGPAALLSATPAQRAAAAQLLGRRLAGRSVDLRLEHLDARARALGWRDGLASALAALDGGEPDADPEPEPEPEPEDVVVLPPTAPLTAVRDEAPHLPDPAWAVAWEPLELLPRTPVDWQEWWRQEQAAGGGAAVAGTPQVAATLAPQLAEVLDFLPAEGELLTDLAEAVTGSPHALDDGPLATLVLRALAWRAGKVLAGPAGEAGGPSASRAQDALWASAGVVRDELASTVLALGLPAAATGATGTALAAWGEVGQPVVLTFRQLRLHPPAWRSAPQGGVVTVCATSTALLALAGSVHPPGTAPPVRAVCAGEDPSVAAQVVLRGLRAAGWVVEHPSRARPRHRETAVRGG